MNSCSVLSPFFRLIFLHLPPLRPGTCAIILCHFHQSYPKYCLMTTGLSPPIYDPTVFVPLNFRHFHYDALICHLLFLQFILTHTSSQVPTPSLTPTSTTNTVICICPSPCSTPHTPLIQSNLHHS